MAEALPTTSSTWSLLDAQVERSRPDPSGQDTADEPGPQDPSIADVQPNPPIQEPPSHEPPLPPPDATNFFASDQIAVRSLKYLDGPSTFLPAVRLREDEGNRSCTIVEEGENVRRSGVSACSSPDSQHGRWIDIFQSIPRVCPWSNNGGEGRQQF